MTYHAIDPFRAPDTRRGQTSVAYCGAAAYRSAGVSGEHRPTQHVSGPRLLALAGERSAEVCPTCGLFVRRLRSTLLGPGRCGRCEAAADERAGRTRGTPGLERHADGCPHGGGQ